MAENRFRLQVKFWLDLHKSEENELADLIAELKQERTFSRVVREGIRLVMDLRKGRLDVLLALFPWVEDALYERFLDQQSASHGVLPEQLARLERLLEQGALALPPPVETARQDSSGPKSLAIPHIPGPPVDDADADLVRIKKAKASGTAAQNFLDSVMRLQQ